MPRQLSKARPKQGAHLASLRRDANLSQAELGRLVGESQQTIAFWEQSDRPPRSDVLPQLARVLGVRVEDLLSPARPQRVRQSGPVGKVRSIFETVQKLPKRQQQRVLDVVGALVEQYRRSAG